MQKDIVNSSIEKCIFVKNILMATIQNKISSPRYEEMLRELSSQQVTELELLEEQYLIDHSKTKHTGLATSICCTFSNIPSALIANVTTSRES